MPDLSSLTYLPERSPELIEAVIVDGAAAPGEAVRCQAETFAPTLATDPLAWTPYVTGAGVFYPKAGDRAIVGIPAGGPPVLLQWWPNAAEPDVSF